MYICLYIYNIQTLTTIPDYIGQLVKQARKSSFFTEGNIWMGKGQNTLFDVTMRLHDCPKISELLGISIYIEMTGYLLLKIQTYLNLIVWEKM